MEELVFDNNGRLVSYRWISSEEEEADEEEEEEEEEDDS